MEKIINQIVAEFAIHMEQLSRLLIHTPKNLQIETWIHDIEKRKNIFRKNLEELLSKE